MHILHYGSFETTLYKYAKLGFLARESRKLTTDNFSYLLLTTGAMTEDEDCANALSSFFSSVASRCRSGREPVSPKIACCFVKANIRDHVIENINKNILSLISEDRITQLIRDMNQMIEKDVSVSLATKNKFYANANKEHLAEYLADLLIYAIQVDPRERMDSYPVQIGNLPPRNQYYAPRTDEFNQLQINFAAGADIQILYGMGGMGKTEFAIDYAYANATAYEYVWWIDCEDMRVISDNYRHFLRIHGIDCDHLDTYALIIKFKEWFDNHNNWLLIYDNCDNLSLPQRRDFQSFLPNYRNTGRILLTSRNRRIMSGCPTIEITTFDEQLSVQFLMRRTGIEDSAMASQLALRLGNHPLALNMAGTYIASTPGQNYSTYIELLNRYGIRLLEVENEEDRYKYTITKIIQMTLDCIARDRNNDSLSCAVPVLLYCIALGRCDRIDLSGFRFLLSSRNEERVFDRIDDSVIKQLSILQKACDNEIDKNELARIVSQYALLKPESDGTFSLHNLQREAIITLIKPNERSQFARACYLAFCGYRDSKLLDRDLVNCNLQLIEYTEKLIGAQGAQNNQSCQNWQSVEKYLTMRRAVFMVETLQRALILKNGSSDTKRLIHSAVLQAAQFIIKEIDEFSNDCFTDSLDIKRSESNVDNPNSTRYVELYGLIVLLIGLSYTWGLCFLHECSKRRRRSSVFFLNQYIDTLKILLLVYNDKLLDETAIEMIRSMIDFLDADVLGLSILLLSPKNLSEKCDLTPVLSDYVEIVETFFRDKGFSPDISRHATIKRAWEEKDWGIIANNSWITTIIHKMKSRSAT